MFCEQYKVLETIFKGSDSLNFIKSRGNNLVISIFFSIFAKNS